MRAGSHRVEMHKRHRPGSIQFHELNIRWWHIVNPLVGSCPMAKQAVPAKIKYRAINQDCLYIVMNGKRWNGHKDTTINNHGDNMKNRAGRPVYKMLLRTSELVAVQ